MEEQNGSGLLLGLVLNAPLGVAQTERSQPNRTVLIVDDDVPLTGRLRELLEYTLGKYSIEVHNVQEARALLKDVPFELVLMDDILPRTPEEQRTIEKAQGVLDDAREIIEQEIAFNHRDSDERPRAERAREKRSEALQVISDNIDQNGGLTLVRQLRESPDGNVLNRDVPILFMLSQWETEILARAIGGERSDMFVKPTNSEDIVEKCLGLLGKK